MQLVGFAQKLMQELKAQFPAGDLTEMQFSQDPVLLQIPEYYGGYRDRPDWSSLLGCIIIAKVNFPPR